MSESEMPARRKPITVPVEAWISAQGERLKSHLFRIHTGWPRDVILKAVADVMRDRKLILDEAASKLDEGIIVSQPYTFIKGAVVTQNELNRYADLTSSPGRGWTRGRYTLTVEVQPIDGNAANISVNAKVEGRTDGATGAEWVTLPSVGIAEEEFLSALITTVTGAPPPGRVE